MTHSLFKTLVPFLATAALAGCGGGGDEDAGAQPPVVTGAFTSTPKYASVLVVTLQGVRLDQGIAATSAGCRNATLSTAAPFVSSATVAYFQCTVSADGVQQLNVTRTSDGMVIANPGFTVPTPQVTLDIGNGAGASGSLVITLAPAQAPLTVDNFLAYVKSGFYNGTVFHRHARFDNLSSFALQGGGYAAPVSAAAAFPQQKPANAPIALESGRGLSNQRYTLAMARKAEPNSATSQFFINTADNLFLDATGPDTGYAVFGSVVTGSTVVDAMVAAPCSLSPINFNSGFTASPDCVPTPNLVIVNATQTR